MATHQQTGNESLSTAQRALVDANLGLVAVHLRRVANLRRPRRDREYDDLFQEGVLGLIEAARRYRPESGIAFAAFALPRIHHAVSVALRRRFHLIRAPLRPGGVADRASGDDRIDPRHVPSAPPGPSGPPRPPRVVPLSTDPAAPKSSLSSAAPALDKETIGERIRAKYERAVHDAADALRATPGSRDDRSVVVDTLVQERFLVADPSCRTALRRIARLTRSSYARVAMCDRQIADRIRATLDADPEMTELRRCARASSDGPNAVITAELGHRLRQLSTDGIVSRFLRAVPAQRTALVLQWVQALQDGQAAEPLARRLVSMLNDRQRERLLWEWAEIPPRRRRAERPPRRRLDRPANPRPPKQKPLSPSGKGAAFVPQSDNL